MFYIADLVFLSRAKILSLPPWHGARWTALFRNVCANAGAALDEAAAFVFPSRSGQAPILPGERLYVRVGLTDPDFLSLFVESFAATEASGEFSPRSLELAAICDATGRKLVWLRGERRIQKPVPLRMESVAAEALCLSGLASWRLELASPLRLPLPAGDSRRKNGDYSPPEFFQDARFLANLLARTRFPLSLASLATLAPDMFRPVSVRSCDLRWETLRYNASRQMALSGVLGSVEMAGAPPLKLAAALVLGQYLGAGKNGRFGLGFWRIPELDACRAIDWPA